MKQYGPLRALLTIAALLLGGTPTLATTVVAVVEDITITVAADSFVRSGSLKPREPTSGRLCKIRCWEQLCFTAAGRYNNKTAGYNLFQSALDQLQVTQHPNEAAERLKTSVAPIIQRVLDAAKTETPSMYVEWQKGTPALAYLFAGFDAHGRALVVEGMVKMDGNGRALPIQEIVRRVGEKQVGLSILGSHTSIFHFLEKTPDWMTAAKADSARFAEQMISMEVLASEKERKYDVGPPIAVVRVTSKSKHFIPLKDGVCKITKHVK